MTFPVLLDSDGEAAGIPGAIEWHTPAMEEYHRALLAARS